MLTSKLSKALAALALSTGLGLGGALAEPTNVKFSTAGNGTYDVSGINEFDWQSSGDLAVVDALPGGGSYANGTLYTTFSGWAANAVIGDTVTVAVHAHARLNDMLSVGGSSVRPPSLSRNGLDCDQGFGCFEVTVAFSGQQFAQLAGPGLLQLLSIQGNYRFYYDSTPDSNVSAPGLAAPTTFTDGVSFLEGSLSSGLGAIALPGTGSSFTSNTVSAYNAAYLETDTPPLKQIIGSTFDSLISQPGAMQAFINVGNAIGLAPYVVKLVDLRSKIDSNSEFSAIPEQAPGACRVTGGGNDVDENLLIANNLNQPFPNSAPLGYAFSPSNPNRYTYGGQVGAPTVVDPGPFGEWTHHQQKGQTDDFVFHAGTHSAPKDTRILTVVCSDPEACQPAAANAGFKQIDFEGTGSFRHLKKGGTVNGFTVVTDSGGGGTRHYFRVHIEDLGEPGGSGGPKPNSCNHKPGAIIGTGNQKKTECKKCPDIYQIEIHATTDPSSPVIYTVGAYVDGGNLQIHPPVKK